MRASAVRSGCRSRISAPETATRSAASILNSFLTGKSATEAVDLLFAQMHFSPVVALLVVDVIILAIGFFVDVRPAIMLLTPIFFAAASAFGGFADPVRQHPDRRFGLGLVTLPVGMCLNVVSTISGLSIVQIFKGALPLLIVPALN